MLKVFLSHHSQDKGIAKAVADRLTRAQCIYDEFNFQPGEPLDEAISEGLKESRIFVLFNGTQTLARPWVKRELEIAESLYKKGKLAKALMIALDPEKSSFAPEWLLNSVYEAGGDPGHIAQIIQNLIDELSPPADSLLLGRDSESSEIETLLVDRDLKANIIFITGLDGIGRRAFSTSMLKTKLGLYSPLKISIAPLDGIAEIILKLLDLRPGLASDPGFFDRSALASLSEDIKMKILVDCLKKAIAQSEPVLFIDEGGIFEAQSELQTEIKRMTEAISGEDNLPVFMLTNRKPALKDNYKHLHLRPLTQAASSLLLQRLTPGLKLDKQLIDKFYYLTGGHPASIRFAARLIGQYGPESMDSDLLRNQTFEIFSTYLKTLDLDEISKRMLALLYSYSPLPFELIFKNFDKEREFLFPYLSKLLDSSVIEISDDYNFYEISSPLIFSASKLFQQEINSLDHSRLKGILEKIYESDPDIERRLLYSRLLGYAKLKTNDLSYDLSQILPSDVFRQIAAFYHEKKYQSAVDLGLKLLEQFPASPDIYKILIKAYIRQDKFVEAREKLNKYYEIGKPHIYHFLDGFLKRHSGDFEGALSAFRLAVENGYDNVSVYREQAQCCLQLRRYEKALEFASSACEKQHRNVYVLDIYIDALARTGKLEEARRHLQEMLALQESEFTLQRAAAFEWAHGDIREARDYMARAILLADETLPFEMYSMSVLISLELGDLETARRCFDYMDRAYPNKRREIRKAILMSLYLAEGQIEAGLLLMRELKSCPLIAVENILGRAKAKYGLQFDDEEKKRDVDDN